MGSGEMGLIGGALGRSEMGRGDMGINPTNPSFLASFLYCSTNSARLMIMRSAYENSSDYINAVYLPILSFRFGPQSYKKKRGYIATQTPLPNTVEDFWLMVLNSETKVIIALDDKKENNVGEYIPKTEIKYGEVMIKRGKEDKNSHGYYDVISCEISQESRNGSRTYSKKYQQKYSVFMGF
ncbi:hypothetical protein LOTGIDRAFT_175699 [Lottia gigantea]|uniref:Tyrosine-protein phosphatase domain-containing protein n=1 Tax=Lottia gigantea TaxID=225164 RepID=V3ZM79_LOTGI|nr:hypothetical protein LOTGIDRAFT_175699 [Lottia gigantea]ESO92468.1 hypothetical protein LOTGIDRAFT_175699 [Lottia gigantea]